MGAVSFQIQSYLPISQVAVGDRVLAYNEATGETGYYTVTAVIAHIDPSLLELTINGETLQTTVEHPFYVVDGATTGRWVEAGDLQVGDAVRHLIDSSGKVTRSRCYGAFSNLRHSNGTGVTHLGYTGEVQDQQTGLVYLRALTRYHWGDPHSRRQRQ